MERGYERENILQRGERDNQFPTGFHHVARSYTGCSGRKIGAFREYIRALFTLQISMLRSNVH